MLLSVRGRRNRKGLPMEQKKRSRQWRVHERHQEKKKKRCWSDLPYDVLALISEKLPTPGDYVRFSAVCRSFRESSSLPNHHLKWDVPSPVHFYLQHGKFASLLPLLHRDRPLSIDLEVPQYDIIGCSHGLVLFFDPMYRFSLFDPRTNTATRLPQPDFPEVLKVAVSESGVVRYHHTYCSREYDDFLLVRPASLSSLSLSSSTPTDCVALCYYYRLRKFVYWTSEDPNRWSLLPYHEPISHPCSLYHRGRFYFVDQISLKAFVCHIGSPSMTKVDNIPIAHCSIEMIKNRYRKWDFRMTIFLVECRGDLLLVVDENPMSHPKYTYCRRLNIFRLDMAEEEASWVEVVDIGSYALFLSHSGSFSISTHDFEGFEPNCIYKTNPSSVRDLCDYDIYHIDTQAIETSYFDGVKCPGTIYYQMWLSWLAPRIKS